MSGPDIGRWLIATGVFLVALGLLVLLSKGFRLGGLPGDITWSGRNWSFTLMLGTSLLLSLVLTVVLNLLFRQRQ